MESLISKAISKEELTQQFSQLGLKPGMAVEVHSSLSSLGFVIGGATAVVDALLSCVGENGTIMMPCQNADNTEPLFWENPPVELYLTDKIRQAMPGYDVHGSEILHMGRIAENLARRENTYHSYHPNSAFIAQGADAKFLMSGQTLHFPLSDSSPLGKLYQLDGYVLLIGVDYENCTALHLSQYRSSTFPILLQGGAVKSTTGSVWKKYLDIDLDCDDFNEIGKILESQRQVRTIKAGKALCRFMRIRDLVDCGTDYYRNKNK